MPRTALPLLLALAACSPFTAPDGRRGDVRFTLDRAEYAVGDTARARLRNLSGERLGYSLCGMVRERWTDDGWRRVERLWICAEVLQTLEPGGEAAAAEPITGEWAPGAYRLVIPVEFAGDEVVREVRSEIFRVVE